MPRSLVERMVGAARLDVDVYEEVEADTSATRQAALVVAIVALAGAVGAAGRGSTSIGIALVGAVVSWMIWSGVTYFVGHALLGGTATWGEMLRTLGFAQSPGVLAALGVVPLVGPLVLFGVSIWTLITGVVAIRQALDVSTGRAIATALLSWVLILFLVGLPLALMGALGSATREPTLV